MCCTHRTTSRVSLEYGTRLMCRGDVLSAMLRLKPHFRLHESLKISSSGECRCSWLAHVAKELQLQVSAALSSCATDVFE